MEIKKYIRTMTGDVFEVAKISKREHNGHRLILREGYSGCTLDSEIMATADTKEELEKLTCHCGECQFYKNGECQVKKFLIQHIGQGDLHESEHKPTDPCTIHWWRDYDREQFKDVEWVLYNEFYLTKH